MATTQNKQSKAFWAGHIEQWQSSGLSQAAYCRQYDLCDQKFSYRKRQLISYTANTASSTGFSRVQVETNDGVFQDTITDGGFQKNCVTGLSLRFCDGIQLDGITKSNLALVRPLLDILR